MSSELAILLTLHQLAAAGIFLWATFCVLSPLVRDGVIGCLLFSMLSLAAFAVVFSPVLPTAHALRATVIMDLFVAAVGIRHVWMKLIWPYIQEWYYRHKGQLMPRRRESDHPLRG
jgi:CBS domain containing-hemolysin-like protein